MLNSQKQIYATTSEKSSGRLYKSTFQDLYDPFQEDVNRIIHSKAFNRLSYKTQVFVNDHTKEDYYRTRLTHSLEVSQIGKTIAHNLGLCEHLTDALCLVHDLGHPPFGHAGEDALRDITQGEFDHNVHCFKIITELEEQYIGYNGLNLSLEVIEGVVKHNGANTNGTAPKIIFDYSNNKQDLMLGLYPCLEAQVSYISDDIAYVIHDIKDGLRANLLTFEDLLEIKIVADRISDIKLDNPDTCKRRLPYKIARELSLYMIKDVINNTMDQLTKYNIKTLEDVRKHFALLVKFSDYVKDEVEELRQFLFKKVYRNQTLRSNLSFYTEILTDLFKIYTSDPRRLPNSWYKKTESRDLNDVVLDYIAGMTDIYAVKQYNILQNK